MPDGLRVKRPEIVVDKSDTLIIYWATPAGFHCYVAEAADSWKNTTLLRMTGPEFTAGDACKHDRRLLSDKGVLSFTADPAGGTEDDGYAILDFDLQSFRGAAR